MFKVKVESKDSSAALKQILNELKGIAIMVGVPEGTKGDGKISNAQKAHNLSEGVRSRGMIK